MNDISQEVPLQCVFCESPTAHSALCSSCRLETGVDDAWVVAPREGFLKTAIDEFKFDRVQEMADHAAELLARRIPFLPHDVSVTYIPTTSAHIRVRGYDHMARVARLYATRRGMDCVSTLERLQNTTQHFSSRKERFANATLAFAVPTSPPQSVLLLDDIVTTGATIRAAAKLLKDSGTEKVYVGVILRQPSRRHASPLVK